MALLLLLALVPLGFLAHQRLQDLRHDWSSYWTTREDQVFTSLRGELDHLISRGDQAAETLAGMVDEVEGLPTHGEVHRLRLDEGFHAVAIYGSGGRLLVWDGIHRGRVPEEVQEGRTPYAYGELPLFSYLYFTYPIPEMDGTAVVAFLLRTDLPGSLRARTGDLASRVARLTGESVRISTAERVGKAAFDFVSHGEAGADTLFSVTVDEPSPLDRIGEVRLGWTRWILAVLLLAWLALATAWRGETVRRLWASVTLVAVAVIVPWGEVLGAPSLFGAATFLLPGPFDVTLGRILALGLALATVAALDPVRTGVLARAYGPALVLLGFPAAVFLLTRGASAATLGGGERDWITFQLTLSVVLALVAGAGLAVGREESEARDRSRAMTALAAAVVVAAALASAVAVWVRWDVSVPPWVAGAWVLPTVLVSVGLSRWRGGRHPLVTWLLAIVLGTTAALPFAWSARVEARMTIAAQQMERLGADVDPYLDFLLGRLARTVDSLSVRGAAPAEILYRGWIDSGLAEEGYPVWLTLWSPGGIPLETLGIGVSDAPPAVVGSAVEEAEATGATVIRRLARPDVHYLLGVPLQGGRVVTGVVPPVEDVGGTSPLGPLLGDFHGERRSPLTLVPLLSPEGGRPDGAVGGGADVDSLRWIRTDQGWSGEISLRYPGERYHGHYLVDLPGPLVITARATLLLVLNLTILLAVWGLGRLALLDARPVGREWRPLVTSFRARVTVALFSFFLLSNAIFGTLAYRTISGAAERAAEVLAERVVEDAAGVYSEFGGSIALLSRQVRADLLEYRDGELREGSSEELVELGLYEGWLPYPSYQALAGREALRATDQQALGRWEYVRAFRLLPDGDILAAPVPLQAGATAVRRREVADLLGFTVVAGGFLSLLLALLVGRTLTRPIHILQVASERVGSGNLGVRLPTDRADEFGSVFGAFNRMVRRLRKARRDLVRTTRRTQAIVEDAATGVLALGAGGRVALVNRRALELLDRDVDVGGRLMEAGGDADEFVRWIRLYFRDGLREAGTEFQFGSRRVRVRARRISREESLGGAVVSLEDVTDELRTERILAWGEMARQVAHEVKNPLTPIKLSIQHIQRAYLDRRPDFEAILGRNVEAALREIDRLAAIASSFSRFGAPEEAGQTPLQPVSLGPVVEEVLTLYASGEGGVRFRSEVRPDLPPVRARPSELKEVLVNLMENSRAAIEEEGRVTVEAEPIGEGVVLRVRDDGSGIPAELLPRIFEPHFSTRSAGTGLGLAIVMRLVESWNAVVSVESVPGTGTVVSVWLQVWDGPEGERGPRPGGGATRAVPSDSGSVVPPNEDEPQLPRGHEGIRRRRTR